MSEIIKISNDYGLTLIIVDENLEDCTVISGGIDSNPTWQEYLDLYKDEYKGHFELIKKAIIELGWVGKTGEEISNDHCFIFSDGSVYGFSWRAWGDLMQAIINKREGYMKYYM